MKVLAALKHLGTEQVGVASRRAFRAEGTEGSGGCSSGERPAVLPRALLHTASPSGRLQVSKCLGQNLGDISGVLGFEGLCLCVLSWIHCDRILTVFPTTSIYLRAARIARRPSQEVERKACRGPWGLQARACQSWGN